MRAKSVSTRMTFVRRVAEQAVPDAAALVSAAVPHFRHRVATRPVVMGVVGVGSVDAVRWPAPR